MKVKLEIFEGPLDLLLYLIKKEHLNIYDIPIAKITEQYLQYLELMKLLDLNIAGEFIVMAATLMHIKSKMLLPPDDAAVEPEEEDPRTELIKKLLEYKKFKEAATCLEKMEHQQHQIYRRRSTDDQEAVIETYFEATLFDLISAFSKALKDVPKDIFYEVIKDEFSVEGKIHDLRHLLMAKRTIHLRELFEQAKNKQEIIVTFLAVLEQIRLKEIIVVQKEIFSEIILMLNEDVIYPRPEIKTV